MNRHVFLLQQNCEGWLTRIASTTGRVVIPMLLLTASLTLAQESRESEQAISPPSTSSKILRSLGLESLPGARGDKAYRKGDYEEALRHYGKAMEEPAPNSPLVPQLDRNIGNTLYRQKRYEEAAEYYEKALKGTTGQTKADSISASRAHHNLGNTFYRKAEAAYAKDSTQMQPVIADLREAVAHYKKALQKDPKDKAAKQNLEMAGSRLQQLLARQKQQDQQQGKPPEPPEPSARAKEARARALQLTQERRYAEAASVLDNIMRTDKTAASFAAHRQRLDDVMKILRGEMPASPASPTSPALQAPRGPQTPRGRTP